MADQAGQAEAIARTFIAQCRREIAAAWVQVEAAREVLRRGRWLLARWTERGGTESDEEARLASSGRSEAARIGMFVLADVDIHHRRRRRDRRGRAASLIRREASHIRRRSASG
jgi:hypothetical protein